MTRLQNLHTTLILTVVLGCASAEPGATQEPATSGEPSASAAAVESSAPVSASASASASAPVTATPRPKAEPYAVTPEAKAVIEAKDRSEDDKKLDDGRHPAETLSFFGVTQGMKVAEIGAGGGYTSELFARAVGPKGKVYGQNSKMLLEKFAEKPWSERLKKPVMKNVVRLDREFDAPFTPEVKALDGVYMVLFYHDTVWLKTDRAKMNKAVFDSLKPGGLYGVIDHSAKDGAADKETETLHRIEQSFVKKEIEAAGFVFVREGNFLRNPGDTLDWNDSPKSAGDKRGTSDRFALLFKKP